MADYNVNMKQWNGTSFDNVLPLAYMANNAIKLNGKTWSDGLTVDIITPRTKVVAPTKLNINVVLGGIDASKYSEIIVFASVRTSNDSQRFFVYCEEGIVGDFEVSRVLRGGFSFSFVLNRGYYKDNQNGVDVNLLTSQTGASMNSSENSIDFDTMSKITVTSETSNSIQVFEYEVIGIK